MPILKQDSKIIRNLAGEILTESDALIDLRSTYGVTKNISDEVDRVKLVNKPCYMINDNSNCIENGAGFDFSANTAGYFKTAPIVFKNNDFTIEFWIKLGTRNPVETIILLSQITDDGNYTGFEVSLDPSKLTMYISGGANANFPFAAFTDQEKYTFENYVHISIARANSMVTATFDGLIMTQDRELTPSILTETDKFRLSGDYRGYNFKHQIDDLAIYNNDIRGIADSGYDTGFIAFTPPKRSSDNE